MALEKITVPDLGDSDAVEVIELLVSVGQEVSENDSLLVLESDKAAMELPAPMSGIVKSIAVNLGDQVSLGDEILTLEVATASPAESDAGSKSDTSEADKSDVDENEDTAVAESAPSSVEPVDTVVESQDIAVPDLGSDDEVEIIELHVAPGDKLEKEDPLVTLESDKAAMEIPSPVSGVVETVKVKIGDKVGSGSILLTMLASGSAGSEASSSASANSASAKTQANAAPDISKPTAETPKPNAATSPTTVNKPAGQNKNAYAGPAVRKLARELGVDLTQVSGSGSKARIVKEDVQAFVKSRINGGEASIGAVSAVPDIDFSQFGEIEEVTLSKMHKVTAVKMHRDWTVVPHVAQFNEVDVTDLEDFRAGLKQEAERKGVRVTFLPFLLKACVKALQEYPQFNVSLHSSGQHLIQKKYYHIGVAVATKAGLLVPVIRDVDKKSIWELSTELVELSDKAKARKLGRDEMQGGCFTISSLGAIGGTGFIPIVNAPEVAILGVAKTQVKPVYVGKELQPRKMLPLTLSYDHRAVNGVDGGLFATYLDKVLSDVRHLIL